MMLARVRARAVEGFREFQRVGFASVDGFIELTGQKGY